jgi:hypothetical protein
MQVLSASSGLEEAKVFSQGREPPETQHSAPPGRPLANISIPHQAGTCSMLLHPEGWRRGMHGAVERHSFAYGGKPPPREGCESSGAETRGSNRPWRDAFSVDPARSLQEQNN